jgi:hypothetical protein
MNLSMVMPGRNDDYAHGFLDRTQRCIDNIYSLSLLHKLDGEVIFVEWNPPTDRPSMEEALDWKNASIPTRIIRVPHSIHARFERSDTFNLFEFTAQNVGIRRATGKFVLAMSADILLSSEMIAYLAEGKLDEGSFYRAIREPVLPGIADPDRYRSIDGDLLYLGACGDFLLMSRERWEAIKGYSEVSYNAYVDGTGVYYAAQQGLHQVILQQPITHIPHEYIRGGLYEPKWANWPPPMNTHENWGFIDSPEITEIRIL